MPRDLLVPLDGSAFADAVLPHAMELARLTRTRLVLLRVHQPVAVFFAGGEPPIAMPNPVLEAEAERVAREWLTQKVKQVDEATNVMVSSEFRVGAAADEIVLAAAERDTYAIVCTTHGTGGWAPEWLGSVTDGVIRHTTVPVIAFSQTATARAPGGKTMLVLLDGTAAAETVLPQATELAKRMGAEITLARIAPPEWAGDALMLLPPSGADPMGIDAYAVEVKRELDETAARVRKDGVKVRSVVISEASTIQAILGLIRETDPDFVAVATASRGVSRLFLRSVADKVLRAGGRPTLVLHRRESAMRAEPQKPAKMEKPRRRRPTGVR